MKKKLEEKLQLQVNHVNVGIKFAYDNFNKDQSIWESVLCLDENQFDMLGYNDQNYVF